MYISKLAAALENKLEVSKTLKLMFHCLKQVGRTPGYATTLHDVYCHFVYAQKLFSSIFSQDMVQVLYKNSPLESEKTPCYQKNIKFSL